MLAIIRCRTFCLPVCYPRICRVRVSIKSFPNYKHLLQENYVEYKHIFFSKCNSTQEVFYNILVHFNVCSFCCKENV